jgi:hypothetical protein
MGFAAQARLGYYGHGGQVQSCLVTSTIMAIGQTIALAYNNKPTQVNGPDKFLPALHVMIEGYNKQDPPTKKMLLVKANVPALLGEIEYSKSGSQHAKAIGGLALIVFCDLLCIGEYTVKGKHNNTKQTVQLNLEDVTFFKNNKGGTLVCLPRMAPASVVMSAHSATLKQRGIAMFVHQEANGQTFNCPVCALARRVLHLQENNANRKTFLSAFFSEGACCDVCGEDVSKALKVATAILQYPIAWGIPIKCTDTHSLRSGCANALALLGILIHKSKRWISGRVPRLRSPFEKN